MKKLQSFAEIQAFLDQLGMFHLDLRLERMKKAVTALELEHLPFLLVQVLGTNGKGSTASFLAELCRAHGYRTGLYLSPHFVSPLERIRYNGHLVQAEDWLEPANQILAHNLDLTYFEFMTLLALLIFRQKKIAVAVLEAGLGGKHDATTALPVDLLCFTPIALDHKDLLGHKLCDIALDKASAIRNTAPVCTAQQSSVVLNILQTAVHNMEARLVLSTPVASEVTLGLQGLHQRTNAGLALTAWRILSLLLDKNAIPNEAVEKKALAQTFLAGRMHSIPKSTHLPDLLLDGAHNPHGTLALVRALKYAEFVPSGLIYSCLKDKDWQTSVRILSPLFRNVPVLIPELSNSRAANAQEVADYWQQQGAKAQFLCGASAVRKALQFMQTNLQTDARHPLLVTGSLYLLAEFYTDFPDTLK